MIAGAISVLLKGDGAHFSKTIGNAKREVSSFSAAVRGMATVGSAIKIGAAGFATSGLARYVSSSVGAIERTRNLASSLDVTQRELEGFNHAAITSGSSAEKMQSVLEKMADTVGSAREGVAGAVDALDSAGVSLDELAGKSVAQQFLHIADSIGEINDASVRLAAIRNVFGKGGGELSSLFKGGGDAFREAARDAEKVGVVLSEVDTERMLRLDNAIDSVSQSWTGLSNTLIAKVAPALSIIGEEMASLLAKTTNMVNEIESDIGRLIDATGFDPFANAGALGMLARGPGAGAGRGGKTIDNGLANLGAKMAIDREAAKIKASPFVAATKLFTQDDYRVVAQQRLNGPGFKANDPQKEGNRLAQQILAEAKEVVRLLRRPQVIKEASVA